MHSLIATAITVPMVYCSLLLCSRDGGLKRAKVKDTFKEEQQKNYSKMLVRNGSIGSLSAGTESDWMVVLENYLCTTSLSRNNVVFIIKKKKLAKSRARKQNPSLRVCVFSVWLVQSLPRAVSVFLPVHSFSLLPLSIFTWWCTAAPGIPKLNACRVRRWKKTPQFFWVCKDEGKYTEQMLSGHWLWRYLLFMVL